jgi:hypothetical protein
MLQTLVEVSGIRARPVAPIQQRTWSDLALTYLYVFRAAVVGSCLLVATVAWLTHVPWLLTASICIAAGEFIESTYYIVVLNWGQRTGRIPPG